MYSLSRVEVLCTVLKIHVLISWFRKNKYFRTSYTGILLVEYYIISIYKSSLLDRYHLLGYLLWKHVYALGPMKMSNLLYKNRLFIGPSTNIQGNGEIRHRYKTQVIFQHTKLAQSVIIWPRLEESRICFGTDENVKFTI